MSVKSAMIALMGLTSLDNRTPFFIGLRFFDSNSSPTVSSWSDTAPFSWELSAAVPDTLTVLVKAEAREITDEGGRVLVADRLVVSEGVVPVLLTVGSFRSGATAADQVEISRSPPT